MTDDPKLPALLPCPFCGCEVDNEPPTPFSIDEKREWWAARCGNPGCAAEIVDRLPESVARKWNARAALAAARTESEDAARLAGLLEKCEALVEIVEGGGCLVWREATQGIRLKDTTEWAQLYVATKRLRDAARLPAAKENDRCPARHRSGGGLPGAPQNPPRWCDLPAGHEGPHKQLAAGKWRELRPDCIDPESLT